MYILQGILCIYAHSCTQSYLFLKPVGVVHYSPHHRVSTLHVQGNPPSDSVLCGRCAQYMYVLHIDIPPEHTDVYRWIE